MKQKGAKWTAIAKGRGGYSKSGPRRYEFTLRARTRQVGIGTQVMGSEAAKNMLFVRITGLQDGEAFTKLRFQFHDDETCRGGDFDFELRHEGKKEKKAGGRFVNARGLFSELCIDRSDKNRTYQAVLNPDGAFEISLIPSFRHQAERGDKLPDALGVYRLLDRNGHIMRFGKGNLRQRLEEHHTCFLPHDWTTVEYFLSNDAEQWEKFFEDEYRREHGALPPLTKKAAVGPSRSSGKRRPRLNCEYEQEGNHQAVEEYDVVA